MKNTASRVMIIGLDGAPPQLVRQWAAAGDLPTLQQVFAAGYVGELESSTPWETPSAWASFMTGMNPGKHGVYDFWSLGYDRQVTISTGSAVRATPFWLDLGSRGKKVGVFGVPLTYPAVPVNGFMIAGTPCVPDRRWLTYPPSLYDQLLRKGLDPGMTVFSGVPSPPEEMFEFLVELIRARAEAALYLMQPLPDALLVNAQLPSCRSPAHALDVDKGHGLFLLQRVAELQQLVTV